MARFAAIFVFVLSAVVASGVQALPVVDRGTDVGQTSGRERQGEVQAPGRDRSMNPGSRGQGVGRGAGRGRGPAEDPAGGRGRGPAGGRGGNLCENIARQALNAIEQSEAGLQDLGELDASNAQLQDLVQVSEESLAIVKAGVDTIREAAAAGGADLVETQEVVTKNQEELTKVSTLVGGLQAQGGRAANVVRRVQTNIATVRRADEALLEACLEGADTPPAEESETDETEAPPAETPPAEESETGETEAPPQETGTDDTPIRTEVSETPAPTSTNGGESTSSTSTSAPTTTTSSTVEPTSTGPAGETCPPPVTVTVTGGAPTETPTGTSTESSTVSPTGTSTSTSVPGSPTETSSSSSSSSTSTSTSKSGEETEPTSTVTRESIAETTLIPAPIHRR